MKKPQLVENWKTLWKSLVMWAAGLGVLLPEFPTILMWIAQQTDLLQFIADQAGSFPEFDEPTKKWIRIVCLGLVILVRPIKQSSISGPPKE